MGEATNATANAQGDRAFRLDSDARRNFPLPRRSIAHSLTGIL